MHAEAPAGRHVTSSDWAFSSPTPNLPLLMRGVIDACTDTAAPASPGEAPFEATDAAARIAALTDIACAAFRGARSARQAAAAQFGAAYEPRLDHGSGGWLGSAEVREACMLLALRCLAVCGTPSGEWLERILQLGGHLVARCELPRDSVLVFAVDVPAGSMHLLVAVAAGARARPSRDRLRVCFMSV